MKQSIYESMIGQKYNNLTVKEILYFPFEKNGGYKYQCKCNCDCGNEIQTLCKYVKNGDVRNCGNINCQYKQNSYSAAKLNAINTYKSYIGQKFNHLTIIDFIYTPNHPQKHLKYQFKVKCDCGFEDIKKCNSIINGQISTCGQYNCPYKINSNCFTIEKYKPYIGQKINHLTILDIVYDKDEKSSYKYKFKVKCDCGFENELVINSVLSYKYTNCGFINCKYSKTGQAIEKYKAMIGQKFNNLTIIDFVYNESEIDQYYRWQFKCKCDCGTNEYYIAVDQLLYRTPNGCNYCQPISRVEHYCKTWLEDLNIPFIKTKIDSDASFQNKIEIDFLIDNIGIELHGLSVHATTNKLHDNPYIGSKPKDYHLNKTISCENQNIDLIQFWNTEWIQKEDICKSIILNRIGKTLYKNYARNCYIKEINKTDYDSFMLTHHIQGTTTGESIRLGLFYKPNDTLVSCMSFGRSRYDSTYEYELFRFANYKFTNIIGAASKLFKYFICNYNPNSIITYSDRRLFNTGKLYSVLGFTFSHNSSPNYWYFKNTGTDFNCKLYHRSSFQKHLLKDKLNYFDPNLTEWENMESNNYLRIYDCGNKVYLWKK